MYRFWTSIIAPLCKATDARSLVEIGVGEGHMTRHLLQYAQNAGGSVHAIDPMPACDVGELCAENGETLTYYAQPSLDILPHLTGDIVLIDGDHNWYTVLNELRSIHAWPKHPIVLLHDTEWPYGWRDMYYAPENIPEEYRQEYACRGILPAQEDLSRQGGLNENLHNALQQGGDRNGVRTAVKDFLRETGNLWNAIFLQGMHGIGILVPTEIMETQPRVRAFLEQLKRSPMIEAWLSTMESHRLRELVLAVELKKTQEGLIGRMKHAGQETSRLQEYIDAHEHRWITDARQLEESQEYIDAHEHRWITDARQLEESRAQWEHLMRTRTIRWTAWVRGLLGILRRKRSGSGQ